MNDLLVIMGASCVSGTMPLYLDQLKTAGIEYHVEDIAGVQQHELNLGWKCRWVRQFGQRFSSYQRLVITDAWDVTFYGTREEVISKIPTTHVLWAAEKNCYPNPAIAEAIEKRTPWAFNNGGMLCGTPEQMIEWANTVERHPKYLPGYLDQEFHNMMLAEKNAKLCTIDDQTNLFFCLFCGYPELEFEKGIPVNTFCDTHPNFLHANGKWSSGEMFHKYERSLSNE
jgi:hypothetical protein